jgi:hypothetical protein
MYREPTTPPLELTADDLPKRTNRVWIVGAFLVLAGAVGGGLYIADKRDAAHKRDVLNKAYGSLATCLLGDPLAGGEKASARMRAIQLAIAESDPKVTKEPATEVWPFRCHSYTQSFIHTVNKERIVAGPLTAAIDKLGQKLMGGEHEQRLADYGALVDEVFTAPAMKVEGVKAAPAPLRPLLTLDELAKFKPLSTKPIATSALKTEVQSHRDLAFAVADPALSVVCGGKDSSDTITCRKLPAEAVAVGGDPLLHAARDPGAVPVVVYGAAASVGAWTTDTGTPAIRGEKFGWAYRKSDGSTVTLSYRNEYKQKFRLTVDGKEPGTMIAPPGKVMLENLYYATALVPGFILWRGANDQGDIKIFAQPIEGTNAGGVQEIGDIGGWYATGTEPQFKSCHTGDALVVAVKDKFTWHVAIHRNGSWTIPAKIDSFDTLTCRKAEATMTKITGRKGELVRQWTCANGICDIAVAELPGQSVRRAIATDAGIVTVSRLYDRGGLHVRVAPIDKLATAKSTALFDDFEQGSESWLRGFELLPFGRAAALVVTTTRGVYVLKIDGEKITPLNVNQSS